MQLPNGSTEIVTVSSHAAAAASVTDTKFLALFGQEFSTIRSGNHVNVFRWNEVLTVENGDYRGLFELFDDAVAQGAPMPVLHMNHPDVTTKDLFSITTPVRQRKNDYGFDDYEETSGPSSMPRTGTSC